MNKLRIEDMSHLIQCLNDLPNHFVYRGQANSDWGLESSLERALGSAWSQETAEKYERFSLMQFQSKYHLYDRETAQPKSKLSWLSTMQHYGVPTRLLDFSESPYVAMYFALESYLPCLGKDLAIYAIDYTDAMDRSIAEIRRIDSRIEMTRDSLYANRDRAFEEVVDRYSCDIIWVTEPEQMNTRLDRQAGSFLLSGNSGTRIEDVLKSQPYSGLSFFKFIVPGELHGPVFALLRKMNITSKSLYGDLEGLARSIRMQIQAYAAAQATSHQ